MRITAVLLAFLAGWFWAHYTPKKAPNSFERTSVLACASLADMRHMLDLIENRQLEVARKLYRSLNSSPKKPCRLTPVGKVETFEVVKRYDLSDVIFGYRLEAVILKVRYGDGRILYIALERILGREFSA